MTPSESPLVSSPNSIEQLISKLGDKLDLTGEEIADVLWLTLEFQKFEASPSEENPESHKSEEGTSTGRPNQPIDQPETSKPVTLPAPSQKEEPNTKPSTEKKGSVYSASDLRATQGLKIGIPDASSLREPLTLAYAFRPLMRRVATGRKFILDEAATAQRIAEERIFIPVLQAEPEPWLDLALVIDESHSMLIWGHTIRELKVILKKYGIFRDIRVWGLQPDEAGNNLQFFSCMGSNKRLTEPKEIIDPTGRRLILIVSDCVSNIWRKGMMFPVLKAWTQKQPLVIVQMLPEWMWRRTALDLGTAVAFKSSIIGAANQELSLHKPLRRSRSIGFKVEDRSKIPVITLDPEKAAQWSQMLVGKADTLVPGYLLPSKLNIEEEIEAPSLQKEQNTLDAAKRVQNFRMTASPLGRELAGLLAASPVINLPVVRLIQETLLPKSNQIQVAEIFLGGLLRPKSASLKKLENEDIENKVNINVNSDLVEYEFIESEIRDIFLDDAAVSDSVDVVNAVSGYVAEQLGISPKEFIAILNAPPKSDKQPKETIQPFAEIAARVLRKLGGESAEFAKKLEEAWKTLDLDREVNTLKSDKPIAAKEAMSVSSNAPIEVFFSYAHEDENLRDELAEHLEPLQRQGIITSWYDREISARTEWAGEIDAHMDTANIILLLISADFLASKYCYSIELRRAMERHAAQEARVIPVILREVDWKDAPFGKLQALPKDAIPVINWENRDEAFADIARGIRNVVKELEVKAMLQQLKKLLRENPTLSSQVRHLLETVEQAESGRSISSVSSEPSQEPAAQGGTQIAQNMHLQEIYKRSEGRLRVVIPRLRDGTGSDQGLPSANIISRMTTVEGLAFGWLLKALSPMMRANQRIECLTPSQEEMFTQGSATFVIGSPSTNELTRSIIARWYHADMTTEATQNYSDIITYQGQRYETEFKNEKRVRDFSFLIYRSEYEYFMCTGTSPFGAAGAVSMVTEPNEGVETIHEYINNRRSFVAIGEVEINSEMHWGFRKVLRVLPVVNGTGDSE